MMLGRESKFKEGFICYQCFGFLAGHVFYIQPSKLAFRLTLLVLISWQLSAASKVGKPPSSLYEIVENQAKHTSFPTIASAAVSKLTNKTGWDYLNQKLIIASQEGKVKILHLTNENLHAFRLLAKKNIRMLRSLKPKNKLIAGKSVLKHNETKGVVFSMLLSRVCLVDVLWEVEKSIKFTLHTGAKPIDNKLVCEVAAWAFSLADLKFSKSRDGKAVVISDAKAS